MKRTSLQLLKFAGVGVLNTVFSVCLFELLRRGLPYLVAYSLSYGAGIGLSYVLNSAYVFKSRLGLAPAMRFPLVYVVQYGLSLILMPLLVEKAHVHPAVALILTVGVTTPVGFVLAKTLLRGARPLSSLNNPP